MVRRRQRGRGGVGEGVLMAGKTAGRQDGRVDTQALLRDAGIEWQGGCLAMAGVSLERIADEVGTPVFVYNAEVVRVRYLALTRALEGLPHRLHYAVKANSNLAILHLLYGLGAGADIVSAGEMHRALAAGVAPDHIVFSGVGKSRDELRQAVAAQLAHINVESLEELELLEEVAREAGRRVPVGIRVNPDVTAETHPYISTGKSGIKFGVPSDQVEAAADLIRASRRLELVCLAMHLGSQLSSPEPYANGIERLLEMLAAVRARGLGSVHSLDIGGGLGIRYAGEDEMDLAAFARAVIPPLQATGLTVCLEPGRFLVGSAGVLLGSVLYRKHSGGKEFVVGDAAMNDLLRPSLYHAHHEIVPLAAHTGELATRDVVGPICETGDFLALERPLPALERGERFAVLGAGAYGFVMSSNYNTRPRAPEVLVDRGRHAVIRPREPLEQLWAGEVVSPFN